MEGPENRLHPRFPCSGYALVQRPAVSVKYTARILNLSLQGCRIELTTQADLEVEEEIDVTFTVNHLPFLVRAQIRHLRTNGILGLQFLYLSSRGQMQLEELLSELEENRLQNAENLAQAKLAEEN